LELKISSRCKVVEDGVYNGAVVFEAAEQGAAVNEVEFLGEEPLVFYVVYLETAVWWDTLNHFEPVIEDRHRMGGEKGAFILDWLDGT
jgi:hypothetical protein